jgi:hypothetical protein
MATFPASWYNVIDFGAEPDNPGFDNTSAFQSALDAAYNGGGGTVFVPAGQWYFGATGLTIDAGVRLAGTSNPLAASASGGAPPSNSSALAYEAVSVHVG